jgi:hypothetical protein
LGTAQTVAADPATHHHQTVLRIAQIFMWRQHDGAVLDAERDLEARGEAPRAQRVVELAATNQVVRGDNRDALALTREAEELIITRQLDTMVISITSQGIEKITSFSQATSVQ